VEKEYGGVFEIAADCTSGNERASVSMRITAACSSGSATLRPSMSKSMLTSHTSRQLKPMGLFHDAPNMIAPVSTAKTTMKEMKISATMSALARLRFQTSLSR
jgi:hypothetical protein